MMAIVCDEGKSLFQKDYSFEKISELLDKESDHITLYNVYKKWDEIKKFTIIESNEKACQDNYINYNTMCDVDKLRNQLQQQLKNNFNITQKSTDEDEKEYIMDLIHRTYVTRIACIYRLRYVLYYYNTNIVFIYANTI